MNRKKTILFVCYGGGHVNMLIPVIKRLKHNNGITLVVMGLTTAKAALSAAGIDSMGFVDFVDPVIDKKALSYGETLTANFPEGPVSPGESLAYHGISFAELVEEMGEEEALKSYDRKGRHAFCPVRFLKRVMEQTKPDMLVSTSSPRAEKAAFLAARELAIPSLCLVDLFGLREIEWIKTPGYASKICVLSNEVKEVFVAKGIPDENIVVTGNPVFDRLNDPALREKGKKLRKERGWDGKKVLLWASQPEPSIHPFTGKSGDPGLPRKIDRELEEFARQNPEWQLVIRFHPSENPVEMSEVWNISRRNENLDELLAACDVIVTMSSTVGLEGYFLGKKIVQILESVGSEGAPYVKMGIATPVYCISKIAEGVANSLAMKGSRYNFQREPADIRISNEVLSILETI